jgi:hypothetical protein
MSRAISYVPYYASCIVLASLFWSNPVVLTLAYVGLSTAMLWRWHETDDIIFYVVPFVLGPVGEAVAIYFGAWSYAKPLELVPLWLPFAWGCAALYMKKTSEAISAWRARGTIARVPLTPDAAADVTVEAT